MPVVIFPRTVLVMGDDQSDDFVKGLGIVLEARGLKPAPFSVRAGLGQTAVRDLFRKGSSPKVSTAQAMAEALGMSIDEIVAAGRGGPVPAEEAAPEDALVPVYNVQASAGYGALVDEEYVVQQLAFPPDYLRRITKTSPKHLKIIGVKGDSMAPTLKDDDVVMVDTTKRDLSWGGIFVIRIDGDGLLVKRVSTGSQRGYFKIVSDNAAAFPAVERLAEDVEVLGRVIWYGVKV